MTLLQKYSIRAGLVVLWMVIISLTLLGIGSIYNYLNTGADRKKMFHKAQENIETYRPKITWRTDRNTGRSLRPSQLKIIERDYLNAWYQKALAFDHQSTEGIEDHFTSETSSRIIKQLAENSAQNISVKSTTLTHQPSVEFFSQDGKSLILTDYGVVEYKQMYNGKSIVYESTEEATYKSFLLLENGIWRIKHLRREKSSPIDLHSIQKSFDFGTIKGINYYPQKTPWDTFGEKFNPKTIKADIELIKEAGLNTVRIFIQFEDFGGEELKQEKVSKLRILLDIAKETEIDVIVTLFDFYGDYAVLDWTRTHRHAEALVDQFKDHKAILAWDIKNEPDLDFTTRGKHNVIAWLKHMIALVKKTAPNHAVTIGWASDKSAALLADHIDFISFHSYQTPQDFERSYIKLKKRFPEKQVVLGEYGVSSYSGLWNVFKSSEQQQADYHRDMQRLFKKHDINYVSWTLYDFKNIPKSVVGVLPWRKIPQKKYGFINQHGRKKKAFEFISGN